MASIDDSESRPKRDSWESSWISSSSASKICAKILTHGLLPGIWTFFFKKKNEQNDNVKRKKEKNFIKVIDCMLNVDFMHPK
jgi:hypothetical protein